MKKEVLLIVRIDFKPIISIINIVLHYIEDKI